VFLSADLPDLEAVLKQLLGCKRKVVGYRLESV
jgi:hypothetical protein